MGTIADMQRAPWWPELIRVKDTMTWVDLAARFQVHPATLRLAMQKAGVEKVSMPRGPKAKAALSEATRVLQTEAGRRPDAEVAIAAGMSVEEVKAWRRERGIPPFLRPPPGKAEGLVKGGLPAAPAGPSAVIRRRSVGEGEPPQELRLPAPPPPARPAAAPPPSSPSVPSSLVGRIEAHEADLGKAPDQEIADRIGVSRSLVGNHRRKLGIPPYEAYKLTGPRSSVHSEQPVEAPVPATEPAVPVETTPVVSEPVVAETVVAAQVVEAPVVEAPVVEAPVVEAPVVEALVLGPSPEPQVEEPIEEPAVEEPTVAEPPIEEPVETPVTAPAPAARLPGPGGGPPLSRLAFRIKARVAEEERRFVIVAATMVEALARAEVALAARSDGPWHVVGVRELSEALS